jgi:RNA recognition motif-containing protein
MLHRKDGQQAMKTLHGKNINNRLLIVKEARSRDERHGQGW